MSNKPSLAEALKPHDRVPAASHKSAPKPQLKETRPRKASTPPSRAGKKALIGYFDPEVSKQLKQMTLDHDRDSVQELLREALNDLFQKYKKPTIA